jgi:signal peptidase II
VAIKLTALLTRRYRPPAGVIDDPHMIRPVPGGSLPRVSRPVAVEFFVVAGLTVLVDQLTKLWVIENFRLGDMGHVLFVPIWRNENLGIANGLLSTASLWVIAGTTVVILAGLAVVVAVTRGRFWTWLPCGLVFGGMLSNLADRLFRGAVTDFLRFPDTSFDGMKLADLAIVIGVAGLLVPLIRQASYG